MGIIKLENIRVYAYHGCLSEETKIGSDYRVDMEVTTDLMPSALSDNLDDTVDYVLLNHIVKEEMAKASKLLERVASRILVRVLNESSLVEHVVVSISKLNPPIGGDVAAVAIKMEESRKN